MSRIAICYDWLDSYGGAERLLHELIGIYPDAELFSLFLEEKETLVFSNNVHVSFLQKLPKRLRSRFCIALCSWVVWRFFDFSSYDFVIVVSSDQAKQIRHKRVLYICLSPPRHIWEFFHYYVQDPLLARYARYVLVLFGTPLRVIDFYSALRVNSIVSISMEVSRRVFRSYGRSSRIVYPPIRRFRL